MKTFEELLQEAIQVSDKRKVVFNQLQSEISNNYLPALATTLELYEESRVFLKLDTKCFAKQDYETDPLHGDMYYGICVFENGSTSPAFREEGDNRTIEWEPYGDQVSFKNFLCPKSACIELACEIKKKIEQLNNHYSKLNEVAEKEML
ncbi:MAG: hypothetical protein RRY36_07770 [Bacteroidaceae bacterium]